MSTPRVDFYVTQDPSPEVSLHLACRVVEKAWQLGNRVFVATASADATRHMDELLWTFRPDSFVPHGRHPQENEEDLPVLVGHDGRPGGKPEVLVNLTTSVPDFHVHFVRIAEFVAGEEESRHRGRQRYAYYRERHYDVKYHRVQ